MNTSGIVYLFSYIFLIGIASFLQKFIMRDMNAYQVNFLMMVGMIFTAIPALWFVQKSFSFPTKALPLGLVIGFMMAIGSISYVLALSKLPVGMAAAVSASYLVVVVLLSWIFLREPMSLLKIIGLILT